MYILFIFMWYTPSILYNLALTMVLRFTNLSLAGMTRDVASYIITVMLEKDYIVIVYSSSITFSCVTVNIFTVSHFY